MILEARTSKICQVIRHGKRNCRGQLDGKQPSETFRDNANLIKLALPKRYDMIDMIDMIMLIMLQNATGTGALTDRPRTSSWWSYSLAHHAHNRSKIISRCFSAGCENKVMVWLSLFCKVGSDTSTGILYVTSLVRGLQTKQSHAMSAKWSSPLKHVQTAPRSQDAPTPSTFVDTSFHPQFLARGGKVNLCSAASQPPGKRWSLLASDVLLIPHCALISPECPKCSPNSHVACLVVGSTTGKRLNPCCTTCAMKA